ncbi:PAS domain-containing protein [Actinomadura gamaensis]|uniref:PAS domain-containing protein n=1 Tax=Actinomadura gamaensis TaxID=1763541 RepID=A0ABV9U1K3_9ACTN
MGPLLGDDERAAAFCAADTPLLIVDTGLVIRDVNRAYLTATGRDHDELVGTPMFEAFPDNPADPAADGVAKVSASFERVFRHGRRDHMVLQRYDIPPRGDGDAFLRRYWTRVNSPLRDRDGRLIGAIHHVEDVTGVVDAVRGLDPSAEPEGEPPLDARAWTALIRALARETHMLRRDGSDRDRIGRALGTHVLVEQARGVIAGRDDISVDQALSRLRQYARREGLPLGAVARAVVEDGLAI